MKSLLATLRLSSYSVTAVATRWVRDSSVAAQGDNKICSVETNAPFSFRGRIRAK